MFGLFYKDLCVMKESMKFVLFGLLFCSIWLLIPWEAAFKMADLDIEGGLINPEILRYTLMPLLTYGAIFMFFLSSLQSNIFAYDERRVWAFYITSTPLSYKGQVLSKYFLSIAISGVGVLWGMLMDFVNAGLYGASGSTSAICLIFFFGQTFMRAMDIPFKIGFGEKNGTAYRLFSVAVMIFLVAGYLLFGPLPAGGSDSVFEFIINLFTNPEVLTTTMLGFLGIAPYVIMLIYYISYKVSCKLYLKGVDGYES